MRVAGIIILVAVLSAVLAPVPLHFSAAEDGLILVTLDVCRGGGGFLSTNGDLQCLCLPSQDMPVLEFAGFVIAADYNPTLFLIPFDETHPPRV